MKHDTWVYMLVVLAVVSAMTVALYLTSPIVPVIVLGELLPGLGIFLAALAMGYLPTRVLLPKFGLAERLICAWALGTGMLSILVLLAGLAGWLEPILWRVVVAGLALGGFAILYYHLRTRPIERVVYEPSRWWTLVLVVAIPCAVLALVCATIPPGLIWSAEGNGYDVLEYHLQVPKEWYQAGRIQFLPHNVYANLPFSAEMLYLLAMVIRQDPFEAVYLCQVLHVGFAVACVAAVWVFVRPFGRFAAAIASTSVGTCGWMMYLAPLPYVEMPMLFTAVVAVGLVVRARSESLLTARTSLMVGLLLGLVGGFKYTGLAMVGPGVVLAFLIVKRPLCAAITIAAAAATLSPYLVRNAAWTGNPVFPLAYKQFAGRDFDDALAERWRRGHQPRDDQKKLVARLTALYAVGLGNSITDRVIRPLAGPDFPRFGLAVLLLPWLVLLTRRRDHVDWLLVMMLIVQTGVWLLATHLQGRFLITWLAVVPFLIGRSAQTFPFRPVVLVLVLAAAAINFHDGYRRYARHVYFDDERVDLFGAHAMFVEGRIPGREYLGPVNEMLRSRTMLIGEATPFYIRGETIYWTVFNRNDFARHAAQQPGLRALKDYIARVRPDFVYVNWSEIARLHSTYGFDAFVRPKVFRYLSSPDQYRLHRIGAWGTLAGTRTPARVLYRVRYTK